MDRYYLPLLTIITVILVGLVQRRRRETSTIVLEPMDNQLDNEHEQGRMNYKDPRDMSREELELFKEKYRSDYTVQDYKNWLMLYKSDPRNLREHHRQNLRKLLRGGNITFEDLPRVLHVPPRDAASYFANMYPNQDIGVQFRNGLPSTTAPKLLVGGTPRLPQAQEGGPSEPLNYLEVGATGALLEYNFGNYSNFIPPQDLEKTWITGTVDLFREKVEPHELNYYVRPDVTTGDERSAVGNKYLQERLSAMIPTKDSSLKMKQEHLNTEQVAKDQRQATNNTYYHFPAATAN